MSKQKVSCKNKVLKFVTKTALLEFVLAAILKAIVIIEISSLGLLKLQRFAQE